MKTVLMTIAMVLSTQSLMAQSIYCTLLKGEGANMYESIGQVQEVKVVPNSFVMLEAPDKSFRGAVQIGDGDHLSLSLYRGVAPDLRYIAFSLTTVLFDSGLVSGSEQIGISCSKAN